MRPRKTPTSNKVFELAGGNEDNYLHVKVGIGHPRVLDSDGMPTIEAVFEPSPEERAAIATGANVSLVVMGTGVPPMSMTTTREQPVGKPNRALDTDAPAAWLELPVDVVDDVLAAITEWNRAAFEGRSLSDVGVAVRARHYRLATMADQLGALKPELARLVAEAEEREA